MDLNCEVVDGILDVTIPASGLIQLATDSMGELVEGSVIVSSDKPLAGVILVGETVGLSGASASLEDGFTARWKL